MFSFLKLLSPAYRKRRASVLRFRGIRPSKRRMYRLVNKQYALMFERMAPKASMFDSFGESRSIPAATGKTIQFFTYVPETRS